MESLDAPEGTPEELLSPPEVRLTQTFITEKPRSDALLVTFLFLISIVVVTQFYWLDWGGWADLLPAQKSKILAGEWWRPFTAIFIHGDIAHLLSNLYMLGIFTYFVYGHFGLKVHPLMTLIGAGFVNWLAILTYPPDTRLLGASGLVYLLGGFWLSLYFFIQRQYSAANRLLRVSGIALMVFFPSTLEPSTSYRTHAIGFAVGVVMACFYFLPNRNRIRKYEVHQTFY